MGCNFDPQPPSYKLVMNCKFCQKNIYILYHEDPEVLLNMKCFTVTSAFDGSRTSTVWVAANGTEVARALPNENAQGTACYWHGGPACGVGESGSLVLHPDRS